MAQVVYSDPAYLASAPCSSTVPVSAAALYLLNATLDELLHITVHAVLLAAPTVPLTVERFKLAWQRIVATQLGKDSLLDAEIALRELLKRSPPSLKADPALDASIAPTDDSTSSRTELAQTCFASLREWVMSISGLGRKFLTLILIMVPVSCADPSCSAWQSKGLCPPNGPANLTTHLSELVAHRNPPEPVSPHISFVLVLYVERAMTSLATRILESLSSVVSRSTDHEYATASDVETALKEDDQVWAWVQEMKVRREIESQARQDSERLKSPSLGKSSASEQHQALAQAARKGSGSSSGTVGQRRASYDSTTSSTVASRGGAHFRKPSLTLSMVPSLSSTLSNDPFDQLISSGQTRKLSMTPEYLRSMERAKKASALNLKHPQSQSSPPVPIVEEEFPEMPNPGEPPEARRKKLKPRGPHQKDVFNDEDEDTNGSDAAIDPDERTPKRTTAKQSLMDLISSPPPWTPPPSELQAVPMRANDSQGSDLTIESTLASGGEEPWVNVNPRKRPNALKAKDERRDIASERQANTDLVNFLRHSPPTSAGTHIVPDQPTKLESKKPKRSLRGIFSNLTGTKRGLPEGSPITTQNPFLDPRELPVAAPRRRPSTANAAQPSRQRTFSHQSNRSLGGGTQTATYALPPGLGGTPEKERERKRALQRQREQAEILVEAETRAKGQDISQPSSVKAQPRSSPDSNEAPVSILKTVRHQIATAALDPDTAATFRGGSSSEMTSNPITTVVRPERSSSLRRIARKPVPRSREPSSTSTGPETTQVLAASVPVVPSAGPVSTLNATSPELDKINSSPESHNGSFPSSSEDHADHDGTSTVETDHREVMSESSETPTGSEPNTQSGIKLRQLLLVDHSKARRDSTNTPSPTSCTEPKAFSSPIHDSPPRLTTRRASTQVDDHRLVRILRQLRLQMDLAHTRDDCLALVDELLESHSSTMATLNNSRT
ncbi:uncharacterized protein JCM15063_003260 [Sporobolomyces koalae]|uniref:uncharacterized protein n=1 Tax=Sporobolomyces koalae TaxID=500713 RepID=UPI00316B62F9